MELIEIIGHAWGWTGIEPIEVVGANDFGNLLVRDARGRCWRICPEDLYCEIVAADQAALDALIRDQEFQDDWNMSALVQEAAARLGPLSPGRKYCLKIPGPLGGEYGGDNLASIAEAELIAVAGRIAHQVKDLPEGSQVQLRIVD